MKYDIKLSPPDITDAEISEVADTLRSGWITTGPKTKKFENQIAQYCGTNKSVCLNSATACLEMTLRMLGIGPGDEVITSAYTYSASCSVICHVGATPVLVDTSQNSFQMDYQQLYDKINEKTKAIIPVDIAGVMCDYDKIYQIINSKKALFKPKNLIQENFGRIIIVADSAHAFGAKYKDKMCGTIADFTNFSFHAVKNLTTSEGGAVTWKNITGISDDEIYKQFMLLSLHGQTKDALQKTSPGSWEYDIMYPAYKCNMTDIMASLGLVQLKRYDNLLQKRKSISKLYTKYIENDNIYILQNSKNVMNSSNHLYMIRLLGKNEEYRNNIIKKMANDGIPTNVHYKPLPMLTAYKKLGFNIKDYKNAFKMYENELTLPLHTLLIDSEIEYIAVTLKKYLNS